jgi:hypothetical protein
MKIYGIVLVYIHVFITSALKLIDQLHAPVDLASGNQWMAGWLGPGVCLDVMKKSEKSLALPKI